MGSESFLFGTAVLIVQRNLSYLSLRRSGKYIHSYQWHLSIKIQRVISQVTQIFNFL